MERLDLGRSFTFMFEDPEWVAKLIVAALIFLVSTVFSILLIGIVGFLILSGYMVAIVRQVARGEELPLPRWEQFGDLFMDGLRVGVALFVWSLPNLILYLPILIASIVASNGSDAAQAILLIITLGCGCLLFLYAIFLAVVTPAIILRVAEEQSIAAAFDFNRILGMVREHLGSFILVVVGMVIAQFVAAFVGLLVCGVGIFVTAIWAMWVEGHLIGQLGRLTSTSSYAEVVTP